MGDTQCRQVPLVIRGSKHRVDTTGSDVHGVEHAADRVNRMFMFVIGITASHPLGGGRFVGWAEGVDKEQAHQTDN